MAAYYNEWDKKTAAWLRELIKAGLIADGEVDERSITEVQPADVAGFTQCHFFAGIGGWSYALRLAGWPDDRAVWTGSCPCQPFSSAGTQAGGADARDLWPSWFRLIRECRPRVVFGEQVESAIGHGWLDRLCDDLEAEGYAIGPVGLPSASVGAFDIRQRLWFVADSTIGGCRQGYQDAGWCGEGTSATEERRGPQQHRGSRQLADACSERHERERLLLQQREPRPDRAEVARGGAVGFVGDPDGEREASIGGLSGRPIVERERGPWAAAEWIPCRDGKWRPVEPGTFPLLNGLSGSLERLRAIEVAGWIEIVRYGNDHEIDAGQVLRMVREDVQSEASWEAAGTGVLQQLHAPEVLLSYLLGVEATRDGTANGGGVQKTCSEAQYRLVRGMHEDNGNDSASRQRRSKGQPVRESSDALQCLSFVLARHAEAYRTEARNAHAASGRIAMLRGYGNAINPWVAKEVIAAYMDIAG